MNETQCRLYYNQLRAYRDNLQRLQRLIDLELERLNEAIRDKLYFNQGHALSEAVEHAFHLPSRLCTVMEQHN